MPISMRGRPMLPSFGRPYASTSGNARHFVGAPGMTWASVSGRVDAEWPCNLPCVGTHIPGIVAVHPQSRDRPQRHVDVSWECRGGVVGIRGRAVATPGCRWAQRGLVCGPTSPIRGRSPWASMMYPSRPESVGDCLGRRSLTFNNQRKT